MSVWGRSFFFVFKRPIAFIVTSLVLALAAWKISDLLSGAWKRRSFSFRIMAALVVVCGAILEVSSSIRYHITD